MDAAPAEASLPGLPTEARRLHRALVEGLIAVGAVPLPAVLAAIADVDVGEIPARLAELAGAGYVALDREGCPTAIYPLSPTPTPHTIRLGGARRYAMCALDALGAAAMLGREVAIQSSCGSCEGPIRMVARLEADGPAATVCCSVNRFACSAACAADLVSRIPHGTVLSAAVTHRLGQARFADLLSESLPSIRPRPRTFGFVADGV